MPAPTSSTLFTSAGKIAKSGCVACVITASSAIAPPGGCSDRVAIMSPIAPPTATDAATAGSSIQRAHAMPTSADNVFPPITDQGCASGLAGTAKTSTALAPKGATSQALVVSSRPINWLMSAVIRIPNAAPTTVRPRSLALMERVPGRKAFSQRRSRDAAAGSESVTKYSGNLRARDCAYRHALTHVPHSHSRLFSRSPRSVTSSIALRSDRVRESVDGTCRPRSSWSEPGRTTSGAQL